MRPKVGAAQTENHVQIVRGVFKKLKPDPGRGNSGQAGRAAHWTGRS